MPPSRPCPPDPWLALEEMPSPDRSIMSPSPQLQRRLNRELPSDAQEFPPDESPDFQRIEARVNTMELEEMPHPLPPGPRRAPAHPPCAERR
jgi:hypothetical protein